MYRILTTDFTEDLHQSIFLPNAEHDTIEEAERVAIAEVRFARSRGRKYQATIHDLDDNGQPTHWRGLNLQTMAFRAPVAVKLSQS